jgi:hypothetical protein
MSDNIRYTVQGMARNANHCSPTFSQRLWSHIQFPTVLRGNFCTSVLTGSFERRNAVTILQMAALTAIKMVPKRKYPFMRIFQISTVITIDSPHFEHATSAFHSRYVAKNSYNGNQSNPLCASFRLTQVLNKITRQKFTTFFKPLRTTHFQFSFFFIAFPSFCSS